MNLKQCWFPGYHSDVGGHSKGSIDTNSVDEIAFAWMCDQVFGLLQLSGTALQKYVLFRIGDLKLDTKNKNIRDLSAAWSKIAWSDGKLDNTNSWMDLWWIPSLLSTASSSYYRIPGETPATETVRGEKRAIDYKQFNEEIHPSVHHRVKTRKYTPTPFARDWKYVEAVDGTRARWVKKKAGGTEIILNEHVISKPGEFQPGSGYDHWQGSLERTFAPKDVLAVQDKLL